ncbi:hypothetical protein, partial [Sphingomonas sp. 37zxx]|uniref:hypothetical protein n=1 Tax=Sphingomonas sp. 37zxx TaxID=1550073 RepID=UPI001E5A5998
SQALFQQPVKQRSNKIGTPQYYFGADSNPGQMAGGGCARPFARQCFAPVDQFSHPPKSGCPLAPPHVV